MDEREQKVIVELDRLNIPYEIHRHEAVYTVDQVVETGNLMPGMNVKNLVIKDKKSGNHYLVIIDDFRRLDFKAFGELTGWSKKARFAGDEDLMQYLGLEAGSCSLFGLVNDEERHMIVVLGREIAEAVEDEIINFHPNVNTATLSITIGDMFKFLESRGNKVIAE